MNLKVLKYILIIIFFSSCANNKKNNAFEITPKEELHTKGIQFLKIGKFDDAANNFKLIFEQYPTSKDLAESELMYAYSLYLSTKYQDAYDVYKNWLLYFPAHEHNIYVKYMIFRCFFNQINDVSRDQDKTRKALEIAIELMHFTNSQDKYYQDVQSKIPLLYDYLAAEQILIGMEQLKINNPIAAINRFKKALIYPNTIHTPEILYRLIESYIILGIDAQATKYFSILNYNYSDNIWNQIAIKNFNKYNWYKKYEKYIQNSNIKSID
ncbi:MAG: outer membrane protein assembly factor BamD [Rickettsiales bacterium]